MGLLCESIWVANNRYQRHTDGIRLCKSSPDSPGRDICVFHLNFVFLIFFDWFVSLVFSSDTDARRKKQKQKRNELLPWCT